MEGFIIGDQIGGVQALDLAHGLGDGIGAGSSGNYGIDASEGIFQMINE
jgi:hypothetical protein